MFFEIFFGCWFFVFIPLIALMAWLNKFFGMMVAAVVGIGIALGLYGIFVFCVYTFVNEVLVQHDVAVHMVWFFALPIIILFLPKLLNWLPLPGRPAKA